MPDESYFDEQEGQKAIAQLYQESKDLGQALGHGHVLTLNVRNQLTYLLAQHERFREFELESQELLKISLDQRGPRDLHTLGSMGNLAVAYAENDRIDEAERMLLQVIEDFEGYYMDGWDAIERRKLQNPGIPLNINEADLYERSPHLVPLMLQLADIYRKQERWQEAEKLQKRCFSIASAVLGTDHPTTLVTMAKIASTFYSTRRLNEAEELIGETLKSKSGVLSAQHPFRLTLEANLAVISSHQDRHEEAIQRGMQVLNTRLKALDPTHRDTLDSLAHMTTTFRRSKQWERAQEVCTQLVETRRNILSAEHAHTLEATVSLMKIHFDQGNWTEAERLAWEVADTRRRLLGPEHISTVSSMSDLARVYTKQGRSQEAEELYMDVIKARKRLLGVEHSNTLPCMSHLLQLYFSLGPERLIDAEQLATEMRDLSIRLFGASNPQTLLSTAALAMIYREQGRHDEAMNLMETIRVPVPEIELPDLVLSEWTREVPSISQYNTPVAAEQKGFYRPLQSSDTIEYIKRIRNFSRRVQNGLSMKPL